LAGVQFMSGIWPVLCALMAAMKPGELPVIVDVDPKRRLDSAGAGAGRPPGPPLCAVEHSGDERACADSRETRDELAPLHVLPSPLYARNARSTRSGVNGAAAGARPAASRNCVADRRGRCVDDASPPPSGCMAR